jgi:hypothetical protein
VPRPLPSSLLQVYLFLRYVTLRSLTRIS